MKSFDAHLVWALTLNFEDIIATVYILINKACARPKLPRCHVPPRINDSQKLAQVAPDYEAAELGVGDSIIIKALCENFGRLAPQAFC